MDGFSFFWGKTVVPRAERTAATPAAAPTKPRSTPTVVVRRSVPAPKATSANIGLPKFLTTPGG